MGRIVTALLLLISSPSISFPQLAEASFLACYRSVYLVARDRLKTAKSGRSGYLAERLISKNPAFRSYHIAYLPDRRSFG